MLNETRAKRWDAGKRKFTDRDAFALRWIGEQYAIRLDQLQRLLGEYAGQEDPLGFETTRKLVGRWMKAKWVEVERLRRREPLWIWLTRAGLCMVDLPYSYRNLESNLDALKHLHAINEIRLAWEEEEMHWVSEREMLHKLVHRRGVDLLHRPDAELSFHDGTVIAIEAELSPKRPEMLSENLMELLRGEQYLERKTKQGKMEAREGSRGERSQYSEIWYFGPPKVCAGVLRERKKLVEQEVISREEAGRVVVKWYPLANGPEEDEQEEQENEEGLDLLRKGRR